MGGIVPEFEGIPIYEGRLLTVFWFATAVIVLAFSVIWFLIYKINAMDVIAYDPKEKRRLKKLKQNAGRSAYSMRKYETALKQYNSRHPRPSLASRLKRNNFAFNAVCVAVTVFVLSIYFVKIFPAIVDYNVKDYKIYEGSYTSYAGYRTSYTVLDDGTKLSNSTDADYEVTKEGKLVYSQRSRIVLGWK